MTNIIVFPLEKLDSRYSAQWYQSVPQALENKIKLANLDAKVIQIDGVQTDVTTTSGAFLNFSDTNRWKSTQLVAFLDMLDKGQITSTDVMVFTDAWNPVILQIKYIRDLMGYKWKLAGLWHAGSYDPTDILGYKMDKPWPWHTERALYYACDHNWFATQFHRNMFLRNLNIPQADHDRAKLSGQPHDLIVNAMVGMNTKNQPKSGVVWPHRYNDDKQPQIAEDLSAHMAQPWCITQKQQLSKAEYYQKLAEHQVIFSCSLHENLGISIMEAVLLDVIPVLPDRCSYSEMYASDFLYPSAWTTNWSAYQTHKTELQQFIQHRLDYPKKYSRQLAKQKKILKEKYLTADRMFDQMITDIANATKTT